MKAHHRGWFTPFPPFFQYFGLSSKFKHLLLLLAKCSSIYFVYKSKVHRGRMCYIVTLWRFLASVSPPVQGGVGGGSCFFILNSKLYILHLYYLFLAIKIPPIMQVNSRTLITSKGSRYWYFSVPIKAVPMTFWLISPPTKREGPNECINVM